MFIPLNIQTLIIKTLYEYDQLWPLDLCLVSQHFFKIVKQLIGSSIVFDFNHQDIQYLKEEENNFDLFFNRISKESLYKSSFFLYSELQEITLHLHLTDSNLKSSVVSKLVTLLFSDQWNDWNNSRSIVIDSSQQLQDHHQSLSLESNQNQKQQIKVENKEGEYQNQPNIQVRIINSPSFIEDPINIKKYVDLLSSRKCKKVLQYISELQIFCHIENDDIDSFYFPKYLKRLTLVTKGEWYSFDKSRKKIDRLLSIISSQCTELEYFGFKSAYLGHTELDPFVGYLNSFEKLTALELFNLSPYCISKIIDYLKEHPSITEFGFSLGTSHNSSPVPEDRPLIEYLFSNECKITKLQLTLRPDSIPEIKRTIPYMIVHLDVKNKDLPYLKKLNQSNIDKDLANQFSSIFREFKQIDHLVLCDTLCYNPKTDYTNVFIGDLFVNVVFHQTACYYLELVKALKLDRDQALLSRTDGISFNSKRTDICLSREMKKYWIVLTSTHCNDSNDIGNDEIYQDLKEEEDALFCGNESTSGEIEDDGDLYKREDDSDYETYQEDSNFEDSEIEDSDDSEVDNLES